MSLNLHNSESLNNFICRVILRAKWGLNAINPLIEFSGIFQIGVNALTKITKTAVTEENENTDSRMQSEHIVTGLYGWMYEIYLLKWYKHKRSLFSWIVAVFKWTYSTVGSFFSYVQANYHFKLQDKRVGEFCGFRFHELLFSVWISIWSKIGDGCNFCWDRNICKLEDQIALHRNRSIILDENAISLFNFTHPLINTVQR